MRRITQGLGVVTDPSALEAGMVPKGAMRQASNVILHRSGAIQPRPGFGDTTGIAERSGAFLPVALWPYVAAEKIVVQSYNGSGSWRTELLDADTQIDATSADVAPPSTDARGTSSAIEARKSLYHTSSTGIRKITVSGTTQVMEAGIWQTYQPIAYSLIDVGGADTDRASLDSTAADVTVAYRWLVRREDETGYVMRGAAGSRVLVDVTTALYTNGAYVELGTLVLPEEALEGDVIELYRTPAGAGGADPGEDYYLAATYTLTAADITAGITDDDVLVDDVKDSNLGVALYSASSQLGALASKGEPPIASMLAWWGSCAWAGNVTSRNGLRLTLTKVGYEAATDRLEGTGLMFNETIEGTFTSGSPTVTGVTFGADVTPNVNSGSVVGMWISDSQPLVSAGTIPTGTKITAISGAGPYTLTMDANATDTGTETVKIGDVVTVDGLDFYAFDGQNEALRTFALDNDAALATRVYQTSVNLASAVAYQAAAGNIDATAVKDRFASGGDGTILFVSRSPRTFGAFTVRCISRPSAFAEADVYAGITSPTEIHPARLHYSAPDEPSAWPPAQFERVGQDGYAILALVPLNDALLVFKEDGIFRVSGSPPNGWVIDTLDASKRLVAPEAVCVLDGVAYAWTDRGVCPVMAGGAGPVLSGPIAHHLREAQRVVPLDPKGPRRGFWMQAHPRLGLVILNYASDVDSETADSGQWVLHVATGAWSTWTRTADRCSAYDALEDRMVVGTGTAAWECLYERSDEDAALSYRDRESERIHPTVWGSSTSVTITEADVGWTPSLCDVVEIPEHGTYHAITAIVDHGATLTLTLSPASADDGACDDYLVDESGEYIVDEIGGLILLAEDQPCDVILHEGYSSTMLWQTQHLPGVGNRWQEIHAQLLDGSSGLLDSWTLELGGQTEHGSAPVDVDATITSDVALSRPVRVGVPRDMARAAHLYPYARVCGAGVLWRLGELQYHHTAEGRRVRR